jgi:hypothetical protein
MNCETHSVILSVANLIYSNTNHKINLYQSILLTSIFIEKSLKLLVKNIAL